MLIPYAKIIINPVAGASSTLRKWRVISKLLKRFGLSYDYADVEIFEIDQNTTVA